MLTPAKVSSLCMVRSTMPAAFAIAPRATPFMLVMVRRSSDRLAMGPARKRSSITKSSQLGLGRLPSPTLLGGGAYCNAWNALLADTGRIRSLCSLPWASAVNI